MSPDARLCKVVTCEGCQRRYTGALPLCPPCRRQRAPGLGCAGSIDLEVPPGRLEKRSDETDDEYAARVLRGLDDC